MICSLLGSKLLYKLIQTFNQWEPLNNIQSNYTQNVHICYDKNGHITYYVTDITFVIESS